MRHIDKHLQREGFINKSCLERAICIIQTGVMSKYRDTRREFRGLIPGGKLLPVIEMRFLQNNGFGENIRPGSPRCVPLSENYIGSRPKII